MNKFKNIVKNLLEKELWSSECEIIQLVQNIDSKGSTIWNEEKPLKVKCVKKETQKMLVDSKFAFVTEFIFSSISLEGINLDKKQLLLKYNGKKYIVEDLITTATLNNEDALVKMVIRR